VTEESGGIKAAFRELAEVATTASEAATLHQAATKSSVLQIRGFILFPNYAESQQLGTQTRPDADVHTDTDADADQTLPDTHTDQTHPDQGRNERDHGWGIGVIHSEQRSSSDPPSGRDLRDSSAPGPAAAAREPSGYQPGVVGCPTLEDLMDESLISDGSDF
jgi:hypothetical protein